MKFCYFHFASLRKIKIPPIVKCISNVFLFLGTALFSPDICVFSLLTSFLFLFICVISRMSLSFSSLDTSNKINSNNLILILLKV